MLRQIGQIDDAVQILHAAASKKRANNPRYDLALGSLLTMSNRKDEAISLFEALLKRHPDSDDVVSRGHARTVRRYVDRGDYGKEAQLELLLQRNPDEAGANNDLGYLYAEQGKNLEKAESMIRKALQEEPDSFAYLDSLGWVLFKKGKVKEALEPLKKAAEQMKSEMERLGAGRFPILEHLGDVYFQLQQLEQANDAWRQAAQAAAVAVPPDKRLGEIKKKLESLEKLGPMPKPTAERTP